jgi:hypothetical protein
MSHTFIGVFRWQPGCARQHPSLTIVRMLKLTFVMGICLGMFGCSKGKLDEVGEGLDSWATKMCACKDKACADKTHEDYKKWENDVLEPAVKGMKESDIDKGTMEKLDKLDDKRKDCRRKFNEETPAP